MPNREYIVKYINQDESKEMNHCLQCWEVRKKQMYGYGFINVVSTLRDESK